MRDWLIYIRSKWFDAEWIILGVSMLFIIKNKEENILCLLKMFYYIIFAILLEIIN